MRLAILALFGSLFLALVIPADVEALGGCTPIAFGQTLAAAISAPGEQDCYSFAGVSGDRIRVRVIATTPWTPFQELLRPDDTVLCSLTGPIKDCTLDATGSHAVRISAAAGPTTGNYSIHVQRLNNPQGCIPIAFGETLAASLGVAGGQDCFTFVGVSGGRVRVRVLETTPWLALQELARPQGTIKCSALAMDDDCTLDVTGPHTILISDAIAEGGAVTGNYTIALSCLVAPCASKLQDVNGDGKADIVWRHSSGDVRAWLLDGATVLGSGSLGGAGSDWTIEAVADFNGDGKSDILWRHTSGVVCIWFLDGLSRIGVGCPGGAGTDWTIQGVGDFNGDGKNDILWRHDSGIVWTWFLDGATIIGFGSPGSADIDWVIQGVADFNGDGKADILWRHTSGYVCIWFLDGLSLTGTGCPGSAGTDWVIERVGDLNADGRADILWRHTSGIVWIWLLGPSFVAPVGILDAGSPGSAGTEWAIEGLADFNGDGKDDILWRHTSTGQVVIWFMNGLTVQSSDSPGTEPDLGWQIEP